MSPGHGFHGSDSDGISPLHPYYSRDYRSTSHMRASLAKDRCFSRGLGVCFRVFLTSQESFSNSWKIVIFHHVWVQKNRSWAKPFDRSVLGSYFMKINDILTKWILKTYSMWEKYVQIMYRSINNSKIYPKCTKTTDWMGRIRTAYPLHPYYSRDYRSTSHLKASLAKDRCFSRGPGVCFRVFLRSQESFSISPR